MKEIFYCKELFSQEKSHKKCMTICFKYLISKFLPVIVLEINYLLLIDQPEILIMKKVSEKSLQYP